MTDTAAPQPAAPQPPAPSYEPDTVEALQACYGEALDEIYVLRSLLAYEAEGLAVHLDYKTFPRSRRKIAEDQIERMRSAARGDETPAIQQVRYPKQVLARAGAEPLLTRIRWEVSRGLRASDGTWSFRGRWFRSSNNR